MSILAKLEGGSLYPSYSSGDYTMPEEWKLKQKIVFGTFFTGDGSSSYIAGYDPLLNRGRSYYGHLENVIWVEKYPATNLTLYSKPGFKDKVADLKLRPISTRQPKKGEVVNRFSSSPIEFDRSDKKLYWDLGTERLSAKLIADYSPLEATSKPAPSKSSEAARETTIVNNITNVYHNTSNNLSTNISTTGSGSVSIGNIGVGNTGAVSNTTNIDNSFNIQTININLSFAITGDSKKSEKVEGTDGDDIISNGLGKDKLIGGKGADQFYFAGEEPFIKKNLDKVIDFDAAKGDAIVIAEEIFENLPDSPALAIADTARELRQLSKDGYELLYLEPKGDLYVDSNGELRGFGNKLEGGIIADLPNDTVLTEADVLIGI